MILVRLSLLGLILAAVRANDDDIDPWFGGPDGNCSLGHFFCDGAVNGGTCIPQNFVCDGEFDCVDRSDEPADCPLKPCAGSQFRCTLTAKCISAGFRCDGEVDCGRTALGVLDESDEADCLQHTACPPGMHRCGDTNHCVELRRFCDGHRDCPEGSDEHDKCKQSLEGSGCRYGAVWTPLDGIACFCPAGLVPNGTDCVDENECRRRLFGQPPVCAQTCVNLVAKSATDKRFECSCKPGFSFQDNLHCKAINVPESEPASVFLISFGKITHKRLKDVVFGKPLGEVTGVDAQAFGFDHRRRRVCWVTKQISGLQALPAVECRNVTTEGAFGASEWVHPAFPVDGVNSLEYDWVSDNWFFLDILYYRVFVCRGLQMTPCFVVRTEGLEKPEVMSIDPTHGLIFLTEVAMKSFGVWRLRMDGSNLQAVTNSSVVHPKAVYAEPATETVYWIDNYLEHVQAVDYQLQGKRRHVASGTVLKTARSLQAFEGTLYSASNLEKIVVIEKLGPANQAPVVREGASDFFKLDRLVVFHRQMQPQVDHPCAKDNGGCAQFCLPVNATARVCRCAEGYRSTEEGRGCSHHFDPDEPLLLFGRTRPGEIAAIPLGRVLANESGVATETQLSGIEPVLGIRRATALTLDPRSRVLYFADSKNFTIHRRGLYEGAMQTLVDTGVRNCEGMALDVASGNLYVSDPGLLQVAVVNVERPGLRRVLVRGNLSNPRGIAVHPAKGWLFWSDWVDGVPPQGPGGKIERARLDGSQRTVIVDARVRWPNGLAIDFRGGWLYWCDAYHLTIERVRFTGADRKVILQGGAVVNPYGIAVSGNTLFWSEFRTSRISRLSMDSNGDVVGPVQLVHQDHAPVFELRLFNPKDDVALLQNVSDVCAPSKGFGGCEHFCFPVDCRQKTACETRTCACADGFSLGPDSKCVPDGNATANTCDPLTHFQCRRSLQCIDLSVVCDAVDDCGDGSDEDRSVGGVCEHFKCPEPDAFLCSSNQCLDKAWVCDGERDCRGGDDEDSTLCQDKVQCASSKFMCAVSKKCIAKSWVCDRSFDCITHSGAGMKDFSDEQDCERADACGPGQFQCHNGKCISQRYVCDSMADCRDGSDEAFCHAGCVLGHEFRCSEDSPCMSAKFRCDGVQDCANGADENVTLCRPEGTHNHSLLECPLANQFQCQKTFQCIRNVFRCDGDPDCQDGTDETDCPELACPGDQFRCADGHRCVPHKFVCDGFRDCVDGSDEYSCGRKLETTGARCLPPMYLCRNDSKNTCLSPEEVCDGKYDCQDKDDEDFLCEDKMCAEATCEQLCFNRPTGYICACRDGFALAPDGVKCLRQDPCAFGSCSQLCEKQGSSRFCHCLPGYEMASDKFTCKATWREDAFLVYTNRYDIRLVRLTDGSDDGDSVLTGSRSGLTSIPLLSQLQNTIAIDFYIENASSILLFWSDIHKDQIFRGRIKSGTLVDVRAIVTMGIWTAEGLAVDWIGRKVYWVDSLLDQIQVVDFDGNNTATVLKEDMHNLRALALDPTKGLMFWTDWQEENPRIERATMAGTQRQVLFRVLDVAGGGWPNGLTCDFTAERVYWIDAKSDSVHSITYDGLDHRQVLRDAQHMAHPFAISVFEEHMYWTDWRQTNIYRANKWNGSDVTLIEDTSNQPFDLKVIHSSRQPRAVKNPCGERNGGCSHLCLMASPTQRMCVCPHMMTLPTPTSTTCIPINQTLVFATSTTVTAIDLDYPNKVVFPLLAPKGDENIAALATDPLRTAVYWSDLYGGRIFGLKLANGSRHEQDVLLKSGADNCFGLAVDAVSGLLYFSGWRDTRAWIAAVTLDGRFRRTVVSSAHEPALRKPTQVNYVDGELYWFDIGYSPPALFRAAANGRKVAEVALKGTDPNATLDAHSLTVDPNRRLFWTQPKLNLTRVLELQSMKLHKIDFANDPLATPTFVALDDDGHELIFYDRVSGDIRARMISANLVAGGKAFELRKSSRQLRANNTHLVAMKMLDKSVVELASSEEVGESPCETLACDQICMRAFKEHKCVCADGFVSGPGGKCVPADRQLMFVANYGDLYWQPADSPENQSAAWAVVLNGNAAAALRPSLVALDAKRNLLYVVDMKVNELFVLNLTHPRNPRKIFAGSGTRLSGVVVEPVSGYVFLSSFTLFVPGRHLSVQIELLHPEAEDLQKTILRRANETIVGLCIDPQEGWLFWLSRTGIQKCRFDGSNFAHVTADNPLVNVLAVDVTRKRLLFVSGATRALFSVDYEGKDLRAIAGPSGIDTLAVLDGVAYFSKKRFLFRFQMDAHGALINETLKSLGSVKSSLTDLKAFDRVEAQSYSTACALNNGGCEQLCFFLGPDTDHRCDCVFSKLNHDGRACGRYRSFLAYARGHQISFAPTFGSLDTDERHESVSAAIERKELVGAFRPIADPEVIRSPVAVAVDPDRFQLFFSDIKPNRIVASKVDQSSHFVVAENVQQVEGLAFDRLHRDLYFTSGAAILRVSLLDDDAHAYPKKATVVLQLSDKDKPRGIAVDPCQMLIYYTNWRVDMPSISRLYYSGFQHETIIKSNIRTPNAITIDFSSQKLYWTDARLDKVERCNYDGLEREIVIENENRSTSLDFPAHPFSLAVYRDHLYYTDWVHRAVLMLSKLDGAGTVVLHANMTDQPMGLAVYADDLAQCGSDACNGEVGRTLKCQDRCRMDAHGRATCACHPGRVLNVDNRTCAGDLRRSECSQDEFLCVSTGRCIAYDETCDGVSECPNGEDESVDYCVNRQCRTGYFACGNGMCVPESKRCNKHNDCGNFKDEHNCSCGANDFRCANGQCVGAERRCDFHKDCSDASDEMNCTKRDCSLLKYNNHTMMNCAHTTQCVIADWFCDGSNDCWDGWDEESCPPSVVMKTHLPSKTKQRECRTDEHQCRGTFTCVPKLFVCDGSKDCATGSDEENCTSRCSEKYEFACRDDGHCIDQLKKCDGVKDCADGSDEAACSGNCNSTRSFLCRNGACIAKSFLCDGVDDCQDATVPGALASDEANCTSIATTFMQCRPSEFQCQTKRTRSAMPDCISWRNFCDGEPDCWDASDEPAGCALRQCEADEFRCDSGQCVFQNWTCNGIPDCRDASDEANAVCGAHYRGQCGAQEFQCANGVCVGEALLCDKKDDCGDASDERECDRRDCERDRPCEDQCTQHRIGFTCGCADEGQTLNPADNRTCINVNRCHELPCSQMCEYTGRASRFRYTCSCAPGYELDPSFGRSCAHAFTAEAPRLVVVTRRHVRLYTLDGHPREVLLSNLTNGVAVDVDVRHGRVYFTDVSMVASVIAFVHHNTSVSSGDQLPSKTSYGELTRLATTSPEGVFVDYLGRNVFWSDRDTHSISVADLGGRFARVLLKGEPLSEPRAIVGDPEVGLLFWSDWGRQAHVGRMTMTGREVKLIVTTSLRWPNALAVDVPAKRLFWGDAHLDYIGSCDYNGDNRRLVLRKSVGRIFGLVVFEDFLYWSENGNRTVMRANKRTGADQSVVVPSQRYKPMGIKVWHSVVQGLPPSVPQPKPHPCDHPNRCDNMCVPSINKQGYECLCAKGFKAEGGRCLPDCNPTDFVCEKTFQCLPFYFKCDGIPDCDPDAPEDEPSDCPTIRCAPGFMLCNPKAAVHNNSNCVEAETICDGRRDCPDGEDEDASLCALYGCSEDQFKCPNSNKCIPLTSLCDGTRDCADGADERDCATHFARCTEPTFFVCRHPRTLAPERCVARSWLCDGERDCPHGDDERQNCEVPRCPSGDFDCGVGAARRCVQRIHLCDGQADCADGEDEAVPLCANRTCSEYEFRCSTGRCIALSWLCDGSNDCSDGLDEKDCGSQLGQCTSQQFMCASDKKCLPSRFRCDGEPDCADKSDEADCSEPEELKCPFKQYPCLDGTHCFSESEKCDGTVHCADYSDERDCAACDNSTFQCRAPASKCIPLSYVCDGVAECADGSDELYCDCAEGDAFFQQGGIRCHEHQSASVSPIARYQCVARAKVCDGIPDCPNGMDEDERVCERHECPASHLKCVDHHCYPHSGYCDGVADCADGSDEKNDYCQTKCKDAFRCDNGRCIDRKHKCDAQDDCGDGSDERDCGVRDCNTFGICSHFCQQRGHAPKCYCAPGYVFEAPNHCKVKDSDSMVLAVLDGRMLRFFNSNVREAVVTLEQRIPHMDYVVGPDGKLLIYYLTADGVVQNGSVEALGNMKARPRRELQASAKSPSMWIRLAVDWELLNVYIVAYHGPTRHGRISIARLDAPEKRIAIVERNLGFVSGLVVSPVAEKLFWSVHEPYPAIESANLDGSQANAIVLSDIYEPTSLIADDFNRRLYWIDVQKGTVETARFDGSDRRVLRKYGFVNGTRQERPRAMDLYNDRLVVIGQPEGRLWHLHKFGGGHDGQLKAIGIRSPEASLFAMHPTKRNPRSDSSCQDKCNGQPCVLINGIAQCVCPAGEYFAAGKCNRLVSIFHSGRIGVCGPYQCQNGGVCHTPTQTCRCPPGTYGTECQHSHCVNRCINNGTCLIHFDAGDAHAKLSCNCPIEFTGERCERFKCTGLCGAHGTCSIDRLSGQTFCRCDAGWHGKNCDHYLRGEEATCADYCFNDGRCALAAHAMPFCECPSAYSGRRCENCKSDAGAEIVCLNGGRCQDRRACVCAPGFAGPECGQDLCDYFCLNNGECLRNSSGSGTPGVQCRCPAGFSGPRCELDACSRQPDFCINGGICVLTPSGEPKCACLNTFTGARCEVSRSCDEYCLFGSTCSLMPAPAFAATSLKQWQCECRPGFQGPRCDVHEMCSDFCQNRGECMLVLGKGPMCKCPKGLGGDRCDQIAAKDCSQLECQNGGECVEPAAGHPRCACRFGWYGLVCAAPTCMGYCANGGTCFVQDDHPICQCPPGVLGPRCEAGPLGAVRPSAPKPTGSMMTMFFAVVLLCVLVLLGMYVVFVKRDSPALKLFRHHRMVEDPDGDMDEFHNPAFMLGDDDGRPRNPQHRSTELALQTTHFANPVFEAGTGVYNDTVMAPLVHSEPEAVPSVIAVSSNAGPTSERRKLLDDPLTDGTT